MLRDAGFLVNPVQPDVIRLAPPLILTAEQADAFLAALRRSTRHARRRATLGGDLVTRHFLRDDDLTPAEQADGARPGRRG